jgi:signal transduction histidine kinase/ActR/RegA family two-component response regulator
MAAWFSSRHPEPVRRAQAEALRPQLRGCALLLAAMLLLGAAAQWPHGLGWQFAAWQGALLALLVAAFLGSRPLVPAGHPSKPHFRLSALPIGAGACGVVWALGLAGWAPQVHPQVALLGVAVTLTFTLVAAACAWRVPQAVIAFSLPLLAGAVFVLAAPPQQPAALAGFALVALHALVTLRLLSTNWARFTEVLALDVERERLATMLREQKDMAERAVQHQARFLAAASHDLRQPMHAISLYLDGLADLPLPERARHAVTDARLCAHDMNDMFRSLLDLSRLDAQQAVPALARFPIAQVLARVAKELQPVAAARGTRLKIRPCAACVFSDPMMVERIVLNFVSNAVRHAAGQRVLVGCRQRGNTLRLVVHDTGPGIPQAQQQAIFEEFHRLDPAAPPDATGGLGLGLAIVRRLAQTLRLEVTVRSTPGRGTLFAVDLPLAQGPRFAPASDDPGAGLDGRLVVVVDDEPSILQAMAFVLRGAGCEVVAARSGEQALAALAASPRPPDAIVCDHALGGPQHGADAIRALREEFNADIPALLVTGDTLGGAAETAARALGVPLLHKPLDAPALTAALEQLLKKK